jgi:hypothetical protein
MSGPTKISWADWADRVTRFSVDPDAATRDDVAQMATELSEIMNYVATDGRYGNPPEWFNGGNVLDGRTHEEEKVEHPRVSTK